MATTTTQFNTSSIPNRVWYVNIDGNVDSSWASRRLARTRKRTLVGGGTTGVSISYSMVTIGSPTTDTHS